MRFHAKSRFDFYGGRNIRVVSGKPQGHWSESAKFELQVAHTCIYVSAHARVEAHSVFLFDLKQAFHSSESRQVCHVKLLKKQQNDCFQGGRQ